MRAVARQRPLPITDTESLIDIEVDKPTPGGRDLLVEVKAVSVNPVDTKVRLREPPGAPLVLGWDAAGVVVAAGPQSRLFKPGDEVFYAGSIKRPGTNAQFHLVDERIVGVKPRTLDFAAAAAMPLTTLTAWEMLLDRFMIARAGGEGRSLLIIGGAGGVGSMAIQLARVLTKLTVIATASRPETTAWCRELGAHTVIDHSKPMPGQLEALGHRFVDYVFSTTNTGQHYDTIVQVIAPQGKFGLIDDPGPIDVGKLRAKCNSLHWEGMFTRSTFQTPDIEEQHRLLTEVGQLVDAGKIRCTLTEKLAPINAANLRRAHALVESGRMRGKIVLEGF